MTVTDISFKNFPRRKPMMTSIILIAAGALLLAGIALLLSDRAVARGGRNRIFTDAAETPERPVAIVLGVSRILKNGRPNLFFTTRIRAAAELYHAGKVRYLLVTGDNSRPDYDEPTDMKEVLIAAGVPAEVIYRDYAGFRTLDSMIRAREIFEVRSAIVVSQRFHLERALFLARGPEYDYIGYNAREIGGYGGFKTRLREAFARLKAVLDIVSGKRPRYGGEKIPIGSASAN